MVEYEVTVHVDSDIADDYRVWLREHVEQMLALPGFVDATVWQVAEPAVAHRTTYCVRYQLRDAHALTEYLNEHAAGMRAYGMKRFGERFAASRRVLTPVGAIRSDQRQAVK